MMIEEVVDSHHLHNASVSRGLTDPKELCLLTEPPPRSVTTWTPMSLAPNNLLDPVKNYTSINLYVSYLATPFNPQATVYIGHQTK